MGWCLAVSDDISSIPVLWVGQSLVFFLGHGRGVVGANAAVQGPNRAGQTVDEAEPREILTYRYMYGKFATGAGPKPWSEPAWSPVDLKFKGPFDVTLSHALIQSDRFISCLPSRRCRLRVFA